METASGRSPSLLHSFRRNLFSLKSFSPSRPFRLVFGLYGGTYLTANILDTIISWADDSETKDATHVSSGPAKFLVSSTANISLCIYKDSCFVKMFGTGPARPVGLGSYLLFAGRDCMTIFASFNLPPLLGPKISEKFGVKDGGMWAQFLAPAACQVFSTPVHLLGLDFYNREGKKGIKDRWGVVRRNWMGSTVARVCRILPAFGVGGVVNSGVRRELMGRLV
ncbi:hypothetical protein QBC38DRAFT_485734 [Podospora fimiseda]|uniref:Sequence orphan n=1 Tax=Podospora fimiseda TaxID=252190 RepID=A0AAN7BJC6_9PEZI|nr:hypothetical protein QBC38DRAFT_485734 [Podospora fimiseda]